VRSDHVGLLNGCTNGELDANKSLLTTRNPTGLADLGVGTDKDRLRTKEQCSVIFAAHQFLESYELAGISWQNSG
jgi:hypothetical protein